MNPYSREVVHALAANWLSILQGYQLSDAYTLSKTEIILCFKKEEDAICLRVLIQYRQLFVFTTELEIIRKSNCQPVFFPLCGHSMQGIDVGWNDRVFVMHFTENKSLLFKWYGPLANIVAFHNEEQIQSFRPEITSDKAIRLNQYHWINAITDAVQGWEVSKDDSREPELILRPYTPSQPHGMQIADAYTVWSKRMHKWCRLGHVKLQQQTQLEQQIKRVESMLAQTKRALGQKQLEVDPKHSGDLLMANLPQLGTGSKAAELHDWISDKKIVVRMDPKLSPVENAEKYYRKAKVREKEMDELQSRLDIGGQQLAELQRQLQQITTATDLNIFDTSTKAEVKSDKSTLPYHMFTFDGYEIKVGKSAATNDLLISNHASPSDLWMHARGVTGSHVIVKVNHKKPVPEPVKRFAASLAAAYSKAKGSEWVPVSYTFRKFVRKPKGAKPGAVVIDREEVIIVQPYKR